MGEDGVQDARIDRGNSPRGSFRGSPQGLLHFVVELRTKVPLFLQNARSILIRLW